MTGPEYALRLREVEAECERLRGRAELQDREIARHVERERRDMEEWGAIRAELAEAREKADDLAGRLATETAERERCRDGWAGAERRAKEAERCSRHNAEHLADFEVAAFHVQQAFFPGGTVPVFTKGQGEALEELRAANEGIVSPNFGVGECKTRLSGAEREVTRLRERAEEAERLVAKLSAEREAAELRKGVKGARSVIVSLLERHGGGLDPGDECEDCDAAREWLAPKERATGVCATGSTVEGDAKPGANSRGTT